MRRILGPRARRDSQGESWSGRSLFVAAPIFLLSAAFFLARTGRDALYFHGRGLFDLPLAYAAIALLSLPMAVLMLSLMRRLGARRTRVVAPLGLAALLVGYFLLARPGGGLLMTGFFVLVPLAFGVLFSVSWLLAADLLDRAPRPELVRAYSVVGAASILGGMAGGLAARAGAIVFEPRALVLASAALLLGASGIMAQAQQTCPPRPPLPGTSEVRSSPGLADFRSVLANRYSLLLLAIGMTASLAGILVEFQFYLAAATSGHSVRQNAHFFANAYLALNLAALLVQLVVLPPLERLVGVEGSLLVLPTALLGGAATLLASAGTLMRSALRIAEGGLKASIHRASWEQAFLPLTRAHRAAAKLLVDGAGARLAEGAAAAGLYLWLHAGMPGRAALARMPVEMAMLGRSPTWLAWLLLGTSLLWILLTRGIGRRLGALVASGQEGVEHRAEIPVPDT